MITFKSFLENKTDNSALANIKRDCQKFLSATDSPLYRGVGLADDKITFVDHPVERRAKDSGRMWNMLFNYAAHKLFGIEDIRKKSIFATGSVTQARVYGAVVMIFPKGDFECLGSTIIHDTYNDIYFDRDLDLKFEKVLKFADAISPSYLDEQEVWEIISHITADINDEMEFTNQLIHYFEEAKKNGRPRIKMATVDATASKLYDIILQNAVSVLTEGNIKQMSIDKAIATRNEIAIYESEGYYAVSLAALDTLLRNGTIKPKTKEGGLALVEIVRIMHNNKLTISSAFPGKEFIKHFKVLIDAS